MPEQRRYKPPPPDACEEDTVPVRLPIPGNELRVRTVVYRNLIVDFAVVQIVRFEGRWITVAKIDCDRGVIHRRQYVRSTGEDILDHQPLCPIPPDRGWDVVDRWFRDALDLMEDEWEDNLRRWRGDTA
ncbi:hypothetical protein E1091_09890 [Micromonospora fluostatini]|uniref:DUF7718 domain-containing protein n=1 Tax=Micromonospora fluostatini TaxID=1629071 RepID=A0ABY2DH15_9ACTN|nr:hypothetical protein E1091_09890 [Micromonospora fluostatini]